MDGEFTITAEVAEVAVLLASFPTNTLTGKSLNHLRLAHGLTKRLFGDQNGTAARALRRLR